MISQPQPTRNATPQVQTIIIIAITLFALSGLMVGFTVGAFVRSANNDMNPTKLVSNHTTPTPMPTPTPGEFVKLGCPSFTYSILSTNPDGTQVYRANIQAKDTTGEINGQCHVDQEKPLTADGITCRIWLVPQASDPQHDPGTQFANDTDQLQHTENFNQPFPQEEQHALVFNRATIGEVQTCMQGIAQWTFTISPTLPKGNYNLIGLTDWKGQSYNWSWATLTAGGKNQ